MFQDGAYLSGSRLRRGQQGFKRVDCLLGIQVQRRKHDPFFAAKPGVEACRVDSRLLDDDADGRRRVPAVPQAINDFTQ